MLELIFFLNVSKVKMKKYRIYFDKMGKTMNFVKTRIFLVKH